MRRKFDCEPPDFIIRAEWGTVVALRLELTSCPVIALMLLKTGSPDFSFINDHPVVI
jgi:hypothetical protein